MDTPTYTATITIGGSSQTTRTAIGNCLPTLINTRQSGKIELTALNPEGTAFDLSSLTNLKAYAKPYNSAETPIELGTGVISGAGNNIYTVTWTKDTFTSGWSSYAEDKDGTIVIWVEMEETGTADFYEWSTRVNIEDGTFTGDSATLPLVSLIFYYNLVYEYDNTTAEADPTAGKFRLNSTTLASVTEGYFADDNKQGVDCSTYLQGLTAGDLVFINNPNVVAESAYFTVTSNPTNSAGYTKIPLTFVDAGNTTFTNGSYFSLTLDSGLNNSFADGTSLNDDNGNELLKFGVTASAVNEVTITNNATGSDPKVSASGADTNIGLSLSPKGTGKIKLTDGTDPTKKVAFDVSGLTTATTRTITVPDSSGTLLFNVVEDTTPALGGNLDMNGFNISGVTPTEMSHLSGITSSVQTQISAKVTGAASSTDNAVARFDSTTGKLIQDSVVTISDTGAVTGVTTLTATSTIQAGFLSALSTSTYGEIRGTRGTGVVPTANQTIASFIGYAFNGTANSLGADMIIRAKETWSGSAKGSSVGFRTIANGTTTQTVRLEIDQDGTTNFQGNKVANAQYYELVDGVTAPSSSSGFARIYVDTADGDLKIIFGDGTTKTIVTDT